jgi:Zn-dependent membrane protease YugP
MTMIFDPMYFIIIAPGFLLAAWASLKVRSTFARYSEQPTRGRLTGAQVAHEILRRNGIIDVKIEETSGMLSDHYDPRHRVLRLSPNVYRSTSVAAVAVAAHEVGHAIQHAKDYAPLALRSAAVPLAQIGSWAPWIIMIGGFGLHMTSLVYLGVILFTGVVLFQVVTLPVEFDASRRAKEQLLSLGLVTASESGGVKSVLSAAAMTYVAGALTAVLTLLYYLLRFGLLGGRRD